MSESLNNIRSRIESLELNFEFKGIIQTNMNQIERETWLLEYEGSQFVFIAGQKNVTLGWDIEKCPLGDGGCSLCGGDGAIYVLPCYTAFYRQPFQDFHHTLSSDYFCYRRIIRLP